MFPLKRFIQGPSLHEEDVSYVDTERSRSELGSLTGEEASKAYQEIIDLPSTSHDVAVVTASSSSATSSTCTTNAVRGVVHQKASAASHPMPKLSQLMSSCESNDYNKLGKNLEQFKDQLDINAVDEYGWTMLMSASCAGSLECVSILLQRGADWTLKDKKGMGAFCLAEKNKHDAVADLVKEWSLCYFEFQERMAHERDSQSRTVEANTSETSSTYCEACRINYKSDKEVHENSIAHLVSTTEFGSYKIHYGIPESNVGFQLMVKSGWDKNKGLGPEGTGQKFPVKTVLKRDKLGLGNDKIKQMPRITHFGPFDPAAVADPARAEREHTVRKREAITQRSKERRKEINFRREFSAL